MRKRLFCLLLTLAALLFSCESAPPATDLTVVFLDVGQGDCTLLRLPEGDILIDAGPEEAEEKLVLRLEALGVRELLLAVFTHADEDHLGGADGVLERFPAKEVWINRALPDTPTARALSDVLQKNRIEMRTVRGGVTETFGELQLSVLYPLDASVGEGNENSLVLLVRYGAVSALFAGDIGLAQETELLSAYAAAHFDCDLYKVAHHGSNTSSSEEFLAAMSPRYAVISCGAGNSYGHPMGEVLERLTAVEAQILRTDLSGEIVFVCDGNSFALSED